MNFFTYVIMLNLFLLVTLKEYDDFYTKTENPIEKFNEILDNFKHTWNKYSNEADSGYRMNSNQLTSFLIELEGDIVKTMRKDSIESIKKYISELKFSL